MAIVTCFARPLAFLACLFALGFVSTANAQRIFRATLDGSQQVPSASTTATGTGTVVLNAAETQIDLTLSFSGLSSNMLASHIHSPGARGVNTGVYIDIGSNSSTAASFAINSIPVSPAEVANLKNGLWYFNVHTANFGGGEIRGQIEPDCSPLAGGLVSWYRAEGNALDQNAINNGTLENGAAFTTGRSGRAFLLDGVNDRIQLGNPASLQLQNFTIEAWVKRSSSTIVTNNPSVGFNGGTFIAFGDNGYGFIIDEPTSKLVLTKVGVSSVFSPTLTVTDTNYHHVAVTKNGGNVTFYIDGVADTPVVYNPIFSFTSNVGIGARGDSNLLNSFFGNIDELSVYNTVLSNAQIEAISNAGAAGKCPACTGTPVGMISWWSGDGNALDSRSRNNGTMTNGATFSEGRNGHAFTFDGVDDYLRIPISPSLQAVSNAITIDMWVKLNSLPSAPGAMLLNNHIQGFGSPVSGVTLSVSPGGNVTFQTRLNNACCQSVTSSSVLQAGIWQHITSVWDGANLRLYIDGSLENTAPATGTLQMNRDIFLGINADDFFGGTITHQVNGLIDEPAIYNRALSTAEIAAMANAGSSSKCKPGATAPPSGVVGWWGGDGDARDISGNNNTGTLQNGAAIAIGKVGQGFSFAGDAPYVEIPDAPSNSVSGQITIEAWIKPAFILPTQAILTKYDSGGSQLSYFFGMQGDELELAVYGTGNGSLRRLYDTTNANIPTGTFTHVAATFDATGQVMKIYVNGVEAPGMHMPVSNTVPSIFDSTAPVRIGAVVGTTGILSFSGSIDEATLYNRALNAAEVSSIYNAGIAGKLKQVSTVFNPLAEMGTTKESNLGSSGPVIPVGDATIFFQGTSSTPGYTQWIPVLQSKLPPLPTQWQGLTYDISTAWQFTGISSVCFAVPSFTPAQFTSLRLYHLEAGNWVNRTNPSSMYPNLCTNPLTSLSPFAIGNLIPNAANVNVGGRVLTASGQGVAKATVSLTDSRGVTRRSRTGPLGYFNFENVLAGETYVVVIGHKRYTFTPRVVTVEDKVTELDFTAME